jgi:hypothetical protein
MDGNACQQPYSVWPDNFNFNYWQAAGPMFALSRVRRSICISHQGSQVPSPSSRLSFLGVDPPIGTSLTSSGANPGKTEVGFLRSTSHSRRVSLSTEIFTGSTIFRHGDLRFSMQAPSRFVCRYDSWLPPSPHRSASPPRAARKERRELITSSSCLRWDGNSSRANLLVTGVIKGSPKNSDSRVR